MKLIVTLIIYAAFSFHAHAGVYKCVIEGKTAFSGKPCGGNAEEIKIRASKSSDQSAELSKGAHRSSSQKTKVAFLEMDVSSNKRKISKSERKIVSLNRGLNAEVSRLRRKKKRASNNLAGATWEESISTEIAAVVEKYKVRVATEQARLDSYQAELKSSESDLKKFKNKQSPTQSSSQKPKTTPKPLI